jgi:hypothetical protein
MLLLGHFRQASQVTQHMVQLGDLRQVSQVTDASVWALQTGVTGYTTLLQFVVSQVTGSSAWT